MSISDSQIETITERSFKGTHYRTVELLGVEWDALLARLKAAEEAYFEHAAKQGDKPCSCSFCDKWRKAAGK